MLETSSDVADPEYASLIGEICIIWNYLEDYVGYLLTIYFEYKSDLAFAVLAGLGNQSRIDLLTWFAQNKDPGSEMSECILYFATAFSICRENRNILVHSAVRLREPDGSQFIEKWSRTKLGSKVRYAYDIKTVKLTIEETRRTLTFASKLFMSVIIPMAELGIKLQQAPTLDGKPKLKPRPLPEKPPLPSKLKPLPPPVHQGALTPPPSSEG